MVETTIFWRGEISSAHKLKLPYKSKCKRWHGHNYTVEIWITGEPNSYGIVYDYNRIKKIVSKLDHKRLNNYISQPTAENISRYIVQKLKTQLEAKITKIKVRVWEDSNSYAEVEETLNESE